MTRNLTPHQRQVRLLKELRAEIAATYSTEESNTWYSSQMRDLADRAIAHAERAAKHGNPLIRDKHMIDTPTPYQRQVLLLRKTRDDIATLSTKEEANVWYCNEIRELNEQAFRC